LGLFELKSYQQGEKDTIKEGKKASQNRGAEKKVRKFN